MNTTRKIAIGLGIAGGAALAAWLLTGDRGKKTKAFVAKKAQSFRASMKTEKQPADDSDVHYV
jgi:hypothetical protein